MNWKLKNKMACLCFMIVLLCITNAFAEEVPKMTCDLCTAEGNTWCMKSINTKGDHCYADNQDDTCPGGETASYNQQNSGGMNADSLIWPVDVARTLFMKNGFTHQITITYNATEPKAATIHNPSSKTLNAIIWKNKCETPESCEITIEAKTEPNFCSEKIDKLVSIDVTVEGFPQKSKIQYYVPCTCTCSSQTEFNSHQCSGHGNYTCGACFCESNWRGIKCDKKCSGRGDIEGESCQNVKYGKLVTCSGNGKCVCGECECDMSLKGSQYFDTEDSSKCNDICMHTMECTYCLDKGLSGQCNQPRCTEMALTYFLQPLNTTIVATERDSYNRIMWVHCETYQDKCAYNYYTKREEGDYYVMMESSCNDRLEAPVVVGASSGGAQVPLILGILGIVAVLATVGGILLWKHLHAMAPVDGISPQYHHIGPTDTLGINPIYKEPTSSYQNPMFKKS